MNAHSIRGRHTWSLEKSTCSLLYGLSFPWIITQGTLGPQQLKRNNTHEMFLPRGTIRKTHAGHVGTLCLDISKFQTPERKASVQHKPYCVYSLGTWTNLIGQGKFHIREGNHLPVKFPDASQGPTLQAGLVKESSYVNSFLHNLIG